jgi:hypothetical protein
MFGDDQRTRSRPIRPLRSYEKATPRVVTPPALRYAACRSRDLCESTVLDCGAGSLKAPFTLEGAAALESDRIISVRPERIRDCMAPGVVQSHRPSSVCQPTTEKSLPTQGVPETPTFTGIRKFHLRPARPGCSVPPVLRPLKLTPNRRDRRHWPLLSEKCHQG